MKEKEKVLLIVHLPPPIHGASMMGKYVYDSKLINNRFNCKFINMSASSNLEEVGRVSFKKLHFMINNLKNVITTVEDFKPSVCYITPTSGGWGFYRDFLMVQALKMKKVNIVLHFHNKSSQAWTSKYYNRFLLKKFFKNVRIMLLGKELFAEKSSFISEDKVYYCPNGIPSVADYKLSKSSKDNTITRFLFLSNMIEEKGVYILLQACNIIKKKGYRFHCDFIGKWKDVVESDFNQSISSMNLDNEVTAHGAKYGKEKVTFFEQADVFVFPTYYHGETFGLVLLEAMDYALPCISTVNGAITSVIEEKETGFCLPQRDIDALVERMIWMMENPIDRVAMGEKGRVRFQQNFTLEKYEERFVNIFDDIITDGVLYE